MQPSLEKLGKFLKLERSRGFDNGAVMGGLTRILEKWESEAQGDGVAADLLAALISRIQAYENLDAPQRKQAAAEMLMLIEDPSKLAQFQVAGQAPKKKPPKKKSDEGHKLLGEELPKALASPVGILDGVGPKSAERLEKLGIFTLEDMLFHLPHRYEDYSQLLPIRDVRYGQTVSISGTVRSKSSRTVGKRRLKIHEIVVEDESGAIRASWMNQPWQTKKLDEGDRVLLSGKVDQYLGRLILSNPEMESLGSANINTNRIVPIYPLTANMSQRWLRKMMHKVVRHWAPRIGDAIPQSLLEQEGLSELSEALLDVHFPRSEEALKAAQYRLAFGELLLLQLGVLQKRAQIQAQTARIIPVDEGWQARQFAQLPFTLTAAQLRSWEEIQADLRSGRPMNRLLQGDVGSGKTVVAGLGASAVIASGAQAAIMAPTSILAEQHFRSLKEQLVGDGLLIEDEIALLQGATT